MQVLLITIWKPNVGGIVTHVENILKWTKNDLTILTYSSNRPLKDEKNVIRVPFLDLPLLRGFSFALIAFLRGLFISFDVIHSHYAIPQGFAGVLLKKVKKKPLVLTVHGSDINLLGHSRFWRPIVAWVLHNADRIITVSSFMRDNVLDFGIDAEKVVVIFNGVESHPPARGEEERLIFIGAFVWQKGPDIMLEAFKEIRSSRKDLLLFMVGDGPMKDDLERMAHQLGVGDGVVFTGYLDDLDEIFTRRSIVVVPSREEGFGLVLLEAMTRMVPVIASKTGAIPEIVKDGKNGLLFSKDHPLSLADAVARLFRDRALWDKLIKGGSETVTKYRWQASVAEIDRVYQEIQNKDMGS